MYLKRLEAFGFKSFAERVKINFDPPKAGRMGINAIIGPNGCGKSNVFDALRWVMGESSAKALRGKDQTALIFKGNKTRSQSGYAEVVITFDNTDRTLKLDADEVSIGRRLRKCGEAEYLINGAICRRRDIRDLLMDSGLGTTSYCFIAQGQIAALIKSSTKERRKVFEEAAGIARFRDSRALATRRLEAVAQNLEILVDKLEDAEARYKKTKAQAASAKRAKRYIDESKAKQITLMLIEFREMFKKRATHKEDLAEIEQAVKKAEAAATLIETELRRIESDDTGLDKIAREAEERRSSVHGEVKRLEAELTSAKESLAESTRQVERIKVEIADLSTQLDERKKGRGSLADEAEAASRDFAQKEELLKELSNKALDAGREVTRLEQELRTAERDANKVTGSHRACEKNLAARITEKKNLAARVEGRKSALVKIEADTKELTSSITTLEGDSFGLQKSIDEQSTDVNTIRTEITNLEHGRIELETKIESAMAELEKYKARIAVLSELGSNKQETLQGGKAVVEAASRRDAPFGGVHGFVGTLFQIDDAYRSALDVALGGRIHDVVVENSAVARAGVDFLRESNLGRASFLPLDRMVDTLRLPKRLAHLDGVIGCAIDLITYDPKFARVFKYLLGRVVVAKNRDVAAQVIRIAGMSGTRAVTLSGEVFDASGPVRGGVTIGIKPGSEQNYNELNLAGSQLSNSEDELNELKANRVEIDKSIVSLRGVLETKMSKLREIELKQAGENTKLQALYKKKKAAHKRHLDTARRFDEAERDNIKNAAEIERLNTELKTFEELEAAGESKISELNTKLNSARMAKEASTHAHAEKRTAFASHAERARAAKRELENHDQGIREMSSRLGTLRNELARQDERAVTARNQITEKEKQLELRSTELVTLSQEADKARSVRDELRTQLESTRKSAADANKRLRAEESRENKLKVSASDLNAKFSSHVEKAREDFEIELESHLQERLEQERVYKESIAAAEAAKQIAEQEATQEITGNTEPNLEQSIALLEAAGMQPHAESNTETTTTESVEPNETKEIEPMVLLDEYNPKELKHEISELKRKLSNMGSINQSALSELEELEKKVTFLRTQHDDLSNAEKSLRSVITKIEVKSRKMFLETFEMVAKHFSRLFKIAFDGGKGDIYLEEGDPLEAGIGINTEPPGRKRMELDQLSGGQQAMTTAALLFAIFHAKPSPFCILDEVDAPLDDANVARLGGLIRDMNHNTQFIMVTHHKASMSNSDKLYGITMPEAGVSSSVVVDLAKADELLDKKDKSTKSKKGTKSAAELNGPFARAA